MAPSVHARSVGVGETRGLRSKVCLPPLPVNDETHRALVAHLLEHSVRRGDFTLKSGAKSAWFIDSKQTVCRPDGLLLMADLALAAIPDDVTAIGGLTVGADPVAYGIAAVGATRGRDLRSFTIRKEAKDHGVQGRLAGALAGRRSRGHHRGHGDARHVVARSGRGRAGAGRRAGDGARLSWTAAAPARPWPRRPESGSTPW